MSVSQTLILTQRDVARLITMKTAVQVIERAFRLQARGQVRMPPKVYLALPDGESDFRAMPAYVGSPPAAGVKWVNVHPANRRRGLPTVMAVIVINDPSTGFPLAVMDGLLVTQMRTAAAAAVAAKMLAQPRASRVGLVGCGAQGLPQLAALAEVLPIRHVKVWGYRPGEAARFCARACRALRIHIEPASMIRTCVRDADIVVTITPSRRPLVKRAWLSPGTHLNAIGADAPGKQELDPAILREAKVIVDDCEQAIHGGEMNVPIAKRQVRPTDIHATLGEVLLGKKPGRTSRDELTVFDSTGLAIHDVALGSAIVLLAHRRRIGRAVSLFSQDETTRQKRPAFLVARRGLTPSRI